LALRLSPITAPDLPRVAEFLHTHLNRRLSTDTWTRSLPAPWKVEAPNHGFMLTRDQAVVGVYVAFYSERMVNGQPERFCNLGPWCVLPAYRFHGPRLLKALLAQPGFSFTDLSPSGSVHAINRRLGFTQLDPATALVPNLPWPSWPRRGTRISADPAVLEQTLAGPELELYRDHQPALAARHLVLVSGDEHCYVMFRKDRRRRLPVFASFLYVSNPQLFRRMSRPLARHLLVRHGALASLAEVRVTGHRIRPSLLLRAHRPKMFRSPHLRADQVDYLYSELTCVAW
jgi:hypothetical protein